MNRVYAARLAGMVVLGPDGESIGRVRDAVISISIVRHQPRVLGLVVELLTRRRIFVPILRVTAIEPGSVTLATGSVSLRRFAQRPNEVLVLGQVVESRVRVDDPDLPELSGIDVIVVDLGIEQTRTRDWRVTKVAVRPQRRLGRRSNVHVVDWQHVQGLTPSGLAMPDQGVAQLLEQFAGQRPVEVAEAVRELPAKRRQEVFDAFDDERLADVLQELPEDEQAEVLRRLPADRAADVLEAMDPDDAADLLGTLTPADAEQFLRRMDPEDSEDVRRLLSHSPDTAGGLMTSEPVVLAPDTTVAEALARVRDPDLTPALASLVFVVRPPTSTPTGRYLGCVHLQRLLREPPAELVSGIIDTDLPWPRGAGLAGLGDPLLRCLQPGLRSRGRRRKSPARRGIRRRRAGPPAARRLARARGTRTARQPRGDMSDLYTPRASRRFAFNVDPEAVGRFGESVARFLGTGRYLAFQTILVIIWVALNLFAVKLQWDPYPFILLNLAFSTQAAYAAPLILLAQNRQENRDRVSLEEDRRRAEQTKADTEFLARELAALRLAVGEVATRDYLRRELDELREMLVELQQSADKPSKKPG